MWHEYVYTHDDDNTGDPARLSVKMLENFFTMFVNNVTPEERDEFSVRWEMADSIYMYDPTSGVSWPLPRHEWTYISAIEWTAK